MPIAEITRSETGERARLLRVDSYDVALDLTRGSEVFGSTSVIRFGCDQPGASTYVDLVAEPGARDHPERRPDRPAPEPVADGRIALTGLAAPQRAAGGRRLPVRRATAPGLHRAVDSADGKVYTYTKFEPAYARRVYANFEQPDLKAEFTFHVTVPAALDGAVEPARARPEPGRRRQRRLALPADAADLDVPDRGLAAGEYHVVRDLAHDRRAAR